MFWDKLSNFVKETQTQLQNELATLSENTQKGIDSISKATKQIIDEANAEFQKAENYLDQRKQQVLMDMGELSKKSAQEDKP